MASGSHGRFPDLLASGEEEREHLWGVLQPPAAEATAAPARAAAATAAEAGPHQPKMPPPGFAPKAPPHLGEPLPEYDAYNQQWAGRTSRAPSPYHDMPKPHQPA